MRSIAKLRSDALAVWRPPPRLTLSQWADRNFYLSPESAAEAGKWKTLPYQRGIMDAITDRRVTEITVMKGARVGYTKIINAAICYYMKEDPCPILAVQPTDDDATGYSKEEIAPMIRDVPVINGLFKNSRGRSPDNTLTHKVFPGGVLSIVGAVSPRGFRRVSRKVVIFDETDGYPSSAGPEGDPISLGIKRSLYYWDRKIIAGSTPTIAGISRIEERFNRSDMRKYHVPCPHCGTFQALIWGQIKWPRHKPREAEYECIRCSRLIPYTAQREMVALGEWRAEKPFEGHAGFHIWAAYSSAPNATWGQLAEEWENALDGGQEALKVFINTILGETWKDKGEAPDWRRIYDRRETYAIGTIPQGGLFLTAGVDVQKDRIEAEVVAWGRGKQSWSVEHLVFMGDPAAPDVWKNLEALLDRNWPHESGLVFPIAKLGIDAGYNSQIVYAWARNYPLSRVMATRGFDKAQILLGSPRATDVSISGRKLSRGYKYWPVGVSLAKGELYGWLRLQKATDEEGGGFPPGYCHFPQYGEEYFKQLTAEQLVKHKKRTGHTELQWVKVRERNEALDLRVIARAAATACGIDRFNEDDWLSLEANVGPLTQDEPQDDGSGGSGMPQMPKVQEKPKAKRAPYAARKGWIK